MLNSSGGGGVCVNTKNHQSFTFTGWRVFKLKCILKLRACSCWSPPVISALGTLQLSHRKIPRSVIIAVDIWSLGRDESSLVTSPEVLCPGDQCGGTAFAVGRFNVLCTEFLTPGPRKVNLWNIESLKMSLVKMRSFG